jgi:hypothetical protein
MLAQRLLVDLELIGDFGLGDASGRSVLDERALVCGRHIFGPVPCRSTKGRARERRETKVLFQDELSSGKFKVDMTAGNVKKVWLLARRGRGNASRIGFCLHSAGIFFSSNRENPMKSIDVWG